MLGRLALKTMEDYSVLGLICLVNVLLSALGGSIVVLKQPFRNMSTIDADKSNHLTFKP